MRRRKEETIVWSKRQRSDGCVGVAGEGSCDRCVSGGDDLDLFSAGASEEGSVGGDGIGTTGVELLQGTSAAVASPGVECGCSGGHGARVLVLRREGWSETGKRGGRRRELGKRRKEKGFRK